MPHELLASIYSDRPAAFEEVMLGGSSDCIGKFWADFPPPACLANDGRHDFRQRCIPVAVHGDGVAISQVARTGSKKVGCISWQSLLCKKQTALSSFLIFFAFAHQVKEEGCFRTWWSNWRHICWSLRALYSGKWPSTDQDGLAWPQGSNALARTICGFTLGGGFCAQSLRVNLHPLNLGFSALVGLRTQTQNAAGPERKPWPRRGKPLKCWRGHPCRASR